MHAPPSRCIYPRSATLSSVAIVGRSTTASLLSVCSFALFVWSWCTCASRDGNHIAILVRKNPGPFGGCLGSHLANDLLS